MDAQLRKEFVQGLKNVGRIAESLEKLVNEPLVEVNVPPPQCPHCGTINPQIKVLPNDEVTGLISEICIEAACLNCNKDIYCLIVEWSIQPDRESALKAGQLIAERVKNG